LRENILKLRYLLPAGDPFKLAILFLLMLVAAVLEVAGIGMIPVFVSIVADPERVLSHPMVSEYLQLLNINDAQGLLLWGSVALVAVFIIKSLYITAFHYFEARYIYNRRYYVSLRMMTSYMQAPYTFHLRRNTAELLRNITSEVNILVNIILTNCLKITKEAIITISILIFLLLVEPLITLLVFLISGAGAGTFLLFTQKKIKQYGIEEQQHRSNMIKAVNQGLGGIKDARVLNREKEFIDKYGDEAYKSTRLLTYIRFVMQIPKPVVEVTAVIGMMLIAALMIWQGRPMASIIPILTLFAMATVRLMPSIQQMSSMYTTLRYNIVSLNPIYDDLKELEEYTSKLVEDRKKTGSMVLTETLAANNVTYQYPGSDETVLKEVSFTIPRGKAVAFVGSSGAGKTTMVDILLGLLTPAEGSVTVDGKNIETNLSAWQRNIGYIPQSIYLADENLRCNIAFGLPEDEIDEGLIENAVELAQLKHLVNQLPEGLDTMVGENGVRLSGGQRQRIGIARALYHNPQVLVMDEATSALDNITEREISSALDALKGDRTIIMIAHRLTTVKNCDTLYLMEEGQITNSGTYEELLKTSSEFKKMAVT